MIKCVNISGLGGEVDSLEALERLFEGGERFEGIEIVVESAEQLTNAQAVAKDREIAICSVSSGRFDLFDLAAVDEQLRHEATADFEGLLRWVGENSSGTRAVVVISAHITEKLGCEPGGSYEQRFNYLFESLEQLTTAAQSQTVTLAMENPGGGLLLSPLEVRDLIDQINSPYLGVCFNCRYAQQLGDPLDWLKILNRRIVALRLPLKDNNDDHKIDKSKTASTLEEDILSEYERLSGNGPIIYKGCE